ncbi:MAG: aminopeptidase P family N-terminal domain-containing protein, partial [Dehalococcoidia bacterium]|nr:aminopeptidase P family N-terminal domain-containing protein [Dehalococcoidia bacterium]
MAIAQRLERLRQLLAEKGLDAILLTQPEDCRYVSGFTGSGGWSGTLLISHDTSVLATDFIHLEQARQEAPDFGVVGIKSYSEAFAMLLSGAGNLRKVAFEANVLTVAEFRQLSDEAEKAKV